MNPRRKAGWLVCTVALTALAGVARGEEPAATFQRGVAAFDAAARIAHNQPTEARRLFTESRDAFAALAATGLQNGRLLYNLGNCHVRLGDVGRAIAAYRRAERLIPGDPDLAENLRYARTLCSESIPPPATRTALRSLLFLHYQTGTRTRALLGLAAYGVFWLAMVAGLFVRGPVAALRWTRGLAAAAALSLGTSVFIDHYQFAHERAGVLVERDVILRKGNGENYEPVFDHKFAAGVEFSLVEPPRGDWLHVELPDGKHGWVRRDQAELLAEPPGSDPQVR